MTIGDIMLILIGVLAIALRYVSYKVECGKTCDIDLTICNRFVEVRAYCIDCDRTVLVRESVSCVKEACIDLVDEMLKALKRKFQEKGNE